MGKKNTNFGFGELSAAQNIAINSIRKEICGYMSEYEALIGFKDFEDQVKVLSSTAVDICLKYVSKASPKAFESFVKLVLSDILEKIAA